jgi:phosphoserine aminotransferase
MENSKLVYNFSAGPCCLPKPVLKKAQEELLDWHGSGLSVMEMSHRSKLFVSIIEKTESDLRQLLSIPENFKILFLQGGASLQNGAIPMNLCGKNKKMNYLVTGAWSKNSFADGKRLGEATEVIPPLKTYSGCPDVSEWTVDPDAKFFHYCDNETIHGVEFHDFPYEEIKDQLLVSDMSSNFCSKTIDWSKFGVVYAGVQKNVGPAGVTIVVVREDLLGDDEVDFIPDVISWKKHADAPGQCYNTPCCWSIYVCGLNIAYMLEKGIEKITEECKARSDLLYNAIDESDGYYSNPVDPKYRSRMNITFRVKCDEELETKFLKGTEKENLIDLKGHRSVGGCRASVYNGMPIEGVQALVDYMHRFRAENP